MAPGNLALTTTFNSVGIELPITGDANANAVAALAFKRASDGTWREGLPLWRTDAGANGGGRAFYGSALLLEAGTDYDIRVTISDPDGVTRSEPLVGAIATRAEDIPAASTLQPTHFVRADGNDEADGRSEARAWRTLGKVFTDAPEGAVIQVGPGYYAAPEEGRDRPLTLLAQHPAVDDERQVINAGQHSVIEQTVAPPGKNTWSKVTVTGPGRTGAPAGATYTIWKWAGSGVEDPLYLGYAADRAASPIRAAYWERNNSDLETVAGTVEKIYTNKSYNYGFFIDNGEDIYLRLPGDLDPNTLYISVRGEDQGGVGVGGPRVRLSGFEFRQVAVAFSADASFGVVDHAHFVSASLIAYGDDEPVPSRYSQGLVWQYNLFSDSSYWVDGGGPAPMPWNFIKTEIVNADDSMMGRPGKPNENAAAGGSGGSRQAVFRYNTIDGPFNGFAVYNKGYDRYAWQDLDLHDNIFRRIGDDAIEPENLAINWRVWNNRIENALVALSTGPVAYGPIYFFRNEIWRLGAHGSPPGGAGVEGGGPIGFKYSGRSSPQARLYIIHNTFWTDQPDVSGGDKYAGGGTDYETFYLRNNIFRMTRYAFVGKTAQNQWDEDYNYFSTTDTGRGLQYDKNYTSDVAGYRRTSGQGAHTNVAGDFITSPRLADPGSGNLTLPAGSPLVDAGAPVPNISDRPGTDYIGSAPDLGATERR